MWCVFDDHKQENKLLQIFVKRYAVYNDIANKWQNYNVFMA